MIIVLNLFDGQRIAVSTSDIKQVKSIDTGGCSVKLDHCNEAINVMNAFDGVVEFWSME